MNLLFDVSFVLILAFMSCTSILYLIVLAKVLDERTRGTMFSICGTLGSIGVLIFQSVGGYLFDNVSLVGPFIFCFVCYVIFAILTLILGIMGKLKILK